MKNLPKEILMSRLVCKNSLNINRARQSINDFWNIASFISMAQRHALCIHLLPETGPTCITSKTLNFIQH